jgi:hypothetical protein
VAGVAAQEAGEVRAGRPRRREARLEGLDEVVAKARAMLGERLGRGTDRFVTVQVPMSGADAFEKRNVASVNALPRPPERASNPPTLFALRPNTWTPTGSSAVQTSWPLPLK